MTTMTISSKEKGLHSQAALVSAVRPDILTISLVTHILGLALPLVLLQIYDRILPAQAYGTAAFLVTGVAVAILLEAILRYGRSSLFASLGARYEAQTTMAALDRLQQADIQEIEKRGTAAISDVLRAIGQVRDFWSGQAGAALYEAPFVMLYIALIAYIGGWLAVIPLALFVLALVMAARLNPAIAQAAESAEQAGSLRHNISWSIFDALAYLKACSAERSITALWQRANACYLNNSATLEARMAWIRENAAAFGQLSTVLIVTFGAAEVVAGQITTGALAACTMLAGRSIGPAMASLGYWAQLARTREAQARVDDLIGLPTNPAFTSNGQEGVAQVGQGKLFVTANTLLAASLTIEPGEVIHLATESPPQTSRLLSAIAGMTLDPEIDIKVDGQALSSFSRDSYRDSVMLVSRHLALVPGSILDNLTLYNANYNADARFWCEKLGLQPYLDKLRYGILTEVGPGTAEHLDEGLYQRIAIIRALLRKPRILLLDHAATGIDLDGVKRLAAILKELQGNTTVLIATYKETLIEACNRSVEVRA